MASNIDATDQLPGELSPTPSKDAGSAIDITLRNSGNAPALIVKAILSFRRIMELDNCTGGAGAAVSAAEYDVKVPTSKTAMANGSLLLARDMRFTVNANSIDRFRISVGPDSYSSAQWPWIYEFNASLVEDNGQKLDLGPMSILGFSADSRGLQWDPLNGATQTEVVISQELQCIARNARELSQAVHSPGLHSPEIQMLYREAGRLTANAPSCRSIPISQNPTGCPAPGGKGTFFSDPRGVGICSDTIEVLEGYYCYIAVDVAKEYEEAKAPPIVSMTFTSVGLVLPMQCLPVGHAEVCRSTDGKGLVVGFIP
jgi:hypothetical protein